MNPIRLTVENLGTGLKQIDTTPVGPSRMKFASQVKKLDPVQPDYADKVAALQDQYVTRNWMVEKIRQKLAESLQNAYTVFPGNLEENQELLGNLLSHLTAAAEHFVVDRY